MTASTDGVLPHFSGQLYDLGFIGYYNIIYIYIML